MGFYYYMDHKTWKRKICLLWGKQKSMKNAGKPALGHSCNLKDHIKLPFYSEDNTMWGEGALFKVKEWKQNLQV